MSNSWYVEFLLRNRAGIRSNIESKVLQDIVEPKSRYIVSIDEIECIEEPKYTINLEDDVYNDLLIVERKVKELAQAKMLTKKELIILRKILDGKNIADIEDESGISRITVSKIFSALCDRIGYLLGGEFTDEGFLDYMKDKFKLDNEQLETLTGFLGSNKRHSINIGGSKS
jgi:hypothetical protein